VTFWLPSEAAPDARSVAVAGSFNAWSVDRHPLKRLKTGGFSLEIELQAGKEYEFRFLIDGGRWENAWNADKYVWCDHAQCENSVITT
jgi:1,4-alpha-glucan branching enzyme